MRYQREVMEPDITWTWHEVLEPDIRCSECGRVGDGTVEGLVWYATNDLARLVSQEVGAECGMSSVAVFCSTVKAARHLGGLDTRDDQTENTRCGHDCECNDHWKADTGQFVELIVVVDWRSCSRSYTWCFELVGVSRDCHIFERH